MEPVTVVVAKPKATRTRKPKVAAAEQPVAEQLVEQANQAVEQPIANAAENPITPKAPRKKAVRAEKVTPFDFTGHAMQKYTDGGWNAFRSQQGAINDFVAHRGTKTHFVRVVPSNDTENLKFAGVDKNSFIQNALSNNAIPVFAKVTPVAKKGEATPTSANVTFTNINDGARVIVGVVKK